MGSPARNVLQDNLGLVEECDEGGGGYIADISTTLEYGLFDAQTELSLITATPRKHALAAARRRQDVGLSRRHVPNVFVLEGLHRFETVLLDNPTGHNRFGVVRGTRKSIAKLAVLVAAGRKDASLSGWAIREGRPVQGTHRLRIPTPRRYRRWKGPRRTFLRTILGRCCGRGGSGWCIEAGRRSGEEVLLGQLPRRLRDWYRRERSSSASRSLGEGRNWV